MYNEPLVPAVQPLITMEDIKEANTDIAIYVISRVSGEGADRKVIEGDYLLTTEEKNNLHIIEENFNHLIVLLNIGAPIDTMDIRSLNNLKALLVVGQAAGVSGLAVADVLTGKVNPEGKLVDTWAKQYEDYPNAMNYAAMNGNLDDEMYSEGVYVGYRYFDSFGIVPAYPFGFGLSYTNFDLKPGKIEKKRGHILFETIVTNTGDRYPGREVVQVYVSAPNGELVKAYQELMGFAKTDILNPGQSQSIYVDIDIRNLACYSSKESAWILDPGDYLFRVGNSSRNTQVAAVLKIEEKIICERCRNLTVTDLEMEEILPKTASTGHFDPEKEEKAGTTVFSINNEEIPCVDNRYRDKLWEKEEGKALSIEETGECLRLQDVLEGKISLDAFVNSLTVEEMSYLCVGNAGDNDEASIVSASGGGSNTDAIVPEVPGTCDTTRQLIGSRGIPNMHMSDGGSGIRLLPEYEVDEEGNLLTNGLFSVRGVSKILGRDYIEDRINHTVLQQYSTRLPMATMLAQTWDIELCGKCGEIIGKEMQDFHVELWLAPSMNIHRNPLGGRNFEYYSEDPYITGECASAVIRSVQSYRCVGTTIKHFACNNQEDNRHGTNVHISERALREICLKGYELL